MRFDNDFNVAFCRLIEKYPALYDTNRADYGIRSVQDNLWQEIGTKLKEPVQDCKERWKNIRGRYSKLKKAQNSGAKKVKEYYLASHLHFIDNFLKTRKPKNNFNEDCSESETEDATYSPSPTSSPPASPLDSKPFRLPSPSGSKTPTFKDVNKSAYDYFLENKEIQEATPSTGNLFDPDLAFLQSVLPDMKSMTAEQKRKFKIGVLSLTGQILDENPLGTT